MDAGEWPRYAKEGVDRKAKVKLRICYRGGEVVDEGFDSLGDCLDYVRKEIVEKNEFAGDIRIWVD